MKNNTMVLYEKKLGKYLLLELKQNNITSELTITLYKKWDKWSSYEATDNVFTFKKEDRTRAIVIYDSMNLRNIYPTFNRLRKEQIRK